MSMIHTINKIRPSLRSISPQSYYISILFAIFNIIVGASLIQHVFSLQYGFIGLIPAVAWGVIFIAHATCMLTFVYMNNWQMIKLMHLIGVFIKSAWWLQLVAIMASMGTFLTGPSKIILAFIYVWTLLICLQFTTYIFFTPRLEDVKR